MRVRILFSCTVRGADEKQKHEGVVIVISRQVQGTVIELSRALTNEKGRINRRLEMDLADDEIPPKLSIRAEYGVDEVRVLEARFRWGALRAGRIYGHVMLMVDVDQNARGTEVLLPELTENIANTVAEVQRTLARYPSGMGSFVLDELELRVPIKVRLDRFGMLRAAVATGQDFGSDVRDLLIRIRPTSGDPLRASRLIREPLDSLQLFSETQIQGFFRLRIFDVGALRDTLLIPSQRAEISSIVPDADRVLDRALLLELEILPLPVARQLIAMGVASPREFTKIDAGPVAERLSELLDQMIKPDHVSEWQKRVKAAIAVPLPELKINT
jgi:hypothetical protein